MGGKGKNKRTKVDGHSKSNIKNDKDKQLKCGEESTNDMNLSQCKSEGSTSECENSKINTQNILLNNSDSQQIKANNKPSSKVLKKRESKEQQKELEESKEINQVEGHDTQQVGLRQLYLNIFNVSDKDSEELDGFSHDQFKNSMTELLGSLGGNEKEELSIDLSLNSSEDTSYNHIMTEVNQTVSKLSNEDMLVELYELAWSKRKQRSLNLPEARYQKKDNRYMKDIPSKSKVSKNNDEALVRDQLEICSKINEVFDASFPNNSSFKEYYKEKFISWFKRLVYMHNNVFYRLSEMSKVEKVEEIIFINSLFKGV